MKYYFIDKEIYYQGKKVPDRKIELFNIRYSGEKVLATDEMGNDYEIDRNELIIE